MMMTLSFFFLHQQLQKNGSVASELPPWSAGDCNITETMEERLKAKPEKPVPALVNSGKHSQTPISKDTTAEITREVQGTQDINLVYSNVEVVRDPATATAQENLQAQGDQTFLSEPHFKDWDSKEIPSQPSRPAPPKPLPYSLSKKLSDTAAGSGSKKVLEKVGF